MTTVVKTSFAAGELAPELHGRADLKAYAEGAKRLRNVLVLPGGGVTRRPGTSFVAELPGKGRLIPVATAAAGRFLLALTPGKLFVFKGDEPVTPSDGPDPWLPTPWSDVDTVRQLAWTAHEDGLLVVHPNEPPKRVFRESSGNWRIEDWKYVEEAAGRRQPYAKFAAADVALQAEGTIAVGGSVTLKAEAPVFVAGHLGVIVRLRRREVLITNVQSPTRAIGTVRQAPVNDDATLDWDEAAFSPAHGWPRSVAFHQGRLVIGGSRDLPNRLWFSKSSRPFTFDTGTGLDDESIVFDLAAARGQAIRHVVAGRALMVFTTEGEWIVSGAPLTPQTVQVDRQTEAGSLAVRSVPPVNVEGAVLFFGPDGRSLREFLFVDTEQAYRANDLALASRHLVFDPVDQAFDDRRRLLFVVREDGRMAVVTLERGLEVTAWTLQETRGNVRSVAVDGERVMLLVERLNGVFLERLNDNVRLDSSRFRTAAQPTRTWVGLDHLEGQVVGVVADGARRADALVADGRITLEAPARNVVAGLGFAHAVEPLPQPAGGVLGRRRTIALTFRVLDTEALSVDAGGGPRRLIGATGGGPVSGEFGFRVLGWRRGGDAPSWRIEQDDPSAFTLLSVTETLKGDA